LKEQINQEIVRIQDLAEQAKKIKSQTEKKESELKRAQEIK